MKNILKLCSLRAINLRTHFIFSFLFNSIHSFSISVILWDDFSFNNINNLIPVKFYINPNTMKLKIIESNRGKSSIYRWVNKVNGNTYIGFSVNVVNRMS